MVHREPKAFGIPGTRWTLERLRAVCAWLRLQTTASLSRLLDRLAIRYKRARDHIHSPDPDYAAKLAVIAQARAVAAASAGRVRLLYADELTYYRQPTLARAWGAQGREQPLAERSHRSNTETRLIATLDPLDGRVLYHQASKLRLPLMVGFWQQVRRAYAEAERLFIVVDNWPIHFHPDVMVALEPQDSPFPRYLPAHWRFTPSQRAVQTWGHLRLPIQLLPLPTYASWTNPIEKLWHYLKREVLHLHRLADALDALRQRVTACLDQFAEGSGDLLRYVGLDPPN